MSRTAENSAYARLLKPTAPAMPPSGGVPEARAWRVALPRAAEASVGLDLQVLAVEQAERTLAEILADWKDTGLALLAHGPGEGRGLLMADAALLSALIEVQTLGRPLATVMQPRPATDVDAALVAPVLDAWIGAVAEEGCTSVAGWHAGPRLADARAAALALNDGGFRYGRLSLSLGDGARSGLLEFCLPEATLATVANGPRGLDDPRLTVATRLDVELHRMALSLGDMRALGVGDEFVLPRAALGLVRLVAGGQRVVGHGRLGRLGAARAVCVGSASAGLDSSGDAGRPDAAPASVSLAVANASETLASSAD